MLVTGLDANVASQDTLEEAKKAMPANMLRKILNDITYEKSAKDEDGLRGPCNHLQTVFSRRAATHKNSK